LSRSVREFTAAIASGGTEAFAHFYRERFDEMYAEARRVTGRDESFCLDVVQDAMMRVIRRLRPIKTEPGLRAWLRLVVQSCAYDCLRREINRRRREQAAAERREQAAADRERQDRLAWLQQEMASLKCDEIRLLVMRYRWGWTLQRMGEALGLRPGAVDGRLRRATAALRRRAAEQLHDG
jgi:RNA polymerase sigma factor (sigma-70 family)